jgi:hypothetical protein
VRSGSGTGGDKCQRSRQGQSQRFAQRNQENQQISMLRN